MRAKSVIGIVAIMLMALGHVAAADGGRPLDTVLLGANEVPTPGDSDGFGTAHLELNQGQATVCYTIELADVEPLPRIGHIHAAPAGSPGGIVLTLFGAPANAAPTTTPAAPTSYPASACVENVSEDLLKAIRQNPEDYYVNLHNSVFPGGAVRGQLGK